MLSIRAREERGHTQIDWLDSYHTFSFGDYYDPQHLGFGDLRVINDDVVQPGKGFEPHPHRDMEILTYVLEGYLAHKDSLGNGAIIRPGELQRMSAGTGILHSEFNPSDTEPVHLLQIWIRPDQSGLTPEYEQKSFASEELDNRWRLVVSPDGRDGSVRIHQDACLHLARLSQDQALDYDIVSQRRAWLHIAKGTLQLNDQLLEAGDGVGITEPGPIVLQGLSRQSEVLLFDLHQQPLPT